MSSAQLTPSIGERENPLPFAVYGVVSGKYVSGANSDEWYVAEIGLGAAGGADWMPVVGEKTEEFLGRAVESGAVVERMELHTSAGQGYGDRREADAVVEAMNGALRGGLAPTDLRGDMWSVEYINHYGSGRKLDQCFQNVFHGERTGNTYTILSKTFERAARDVIHSLTSLYDGEAVYARVYGIPESYRNLTSKRGFDLAFTLASADGRKYRGVYRYGYIDPHPPRPESRFAQSIKELDERLAEALREMGESPPEVEEPEP